MKHPAYFGFLRVALAELDLALGDIANNLKKIISLANQADKEDCRFIVFPSLPLSGGSLGDILGWQNILTESKQALITLAKETKDFTGFIIIGLPWAWQNKVYNCLGVLGQGRVISLHPQRVLQKESRVFSPWPDGQEAEVTFGPWNVKVTNSAIYDSHFKTNIHLLQGEELKYFNPQSSADILIWVQSQEATAGSKDLLLNTLKSYSQMHQGAIVYTSPEVGESSAEYVYTGLRVAAQNGRLLDAKTAEDNCPLLVLDLHLAKIKALQQKEESSLKQASVRTKPSSTLDLPNINMRYHNSALYHNLEANPWFGDIKPGAEDFLAAEAFELQVLALNRRFKLLGHSKGVLGVSGGLDSTLTLLVAVEACKRNGQDSNNILGVTLPGFGTSDCTYQNALKLMTELKISKKEIDIKPACLQHFKDIGHDLNIFDTTYENAQARERTQILMDLANKTGGILLGSGDLSEIALGWCTYGADQMSMYNPNHSLTKTNIRRIILWYAKTQASKPLAQMLLDVLNTPVSPELLPLSEGQIAQKTEEVLGPYELHDFFLYYGVYLGLPPQEVLYLAEQTFLQFQPEFIKDCLRVFYLRFLTQQFKRNPLPDGARVTNFGFNNRDWQMPSDLLVTMWLQELED